MLSLINIVVKISSQTGWGVAWTCHDRLGPEIFRQWLAVTTTSVSNQFVAIEWDEVPIRNR